MVVGVDAGMSGFRAETKNQRSAPSANPPDGTRQNSGPLDPVERPAARRLAPQNLIRANRDASTRPQPSRWRRPSFMRRTSYRKSLLRMVIWCSSWAARHWGNSTRAARHASIQGEQILSSTDALFRAE